MFYFSIVKRVNLILLALLLPVMLYAVGPAYKVQKKVMVKKLTLVNNQLLSVDNQYGNVQIKGWHGKSVMLTITLTGQAARQSRAKALIQFIKIKNSSTPGTINFETAIDTLAQHINPSAGEQCHIDYVIFAPERLRLTVSNRFGNVDVEGFDGELAINENFGDLKIAHTSGPLYIDVEQGNADIDRLCNGSLKFKGFNNVRIGELSGTVDAKFWSGGGVDLGLSNDLQKLDINAANVTPLNITNLKPANAELKIHSKVSKIIYNGHILISITRPLSLTLKKPLKTDSGVFITGKGDTSQKSREKLLTLKKISVKAMENMDYTLKTGSASTPIKIVASFCVVKVTD